MFKMQTPSLSRPTPAAPPQSADILSHSNRSATSSDTMVGRRIKHMRRRNGLTQKEVAGRIGVTGAQFHRYEVGVTRVAASRLIAIANVLGVRPEDLMRDELPREIVAPEPQLPATNDLLELVEMFSAIADHRRRCVLVNFARSLATQSSSPAAAA